MEYYPKIEEEINKNLPEGIKLFDIQNVVRGFNFTRDVSKRRYIYLAPFYLFSRKEEKNLDLLIEKINFLTKQFQGILFFNF